MTEFEHLLQCSLADMQGETPYNEQELEFLRRAAWKKQSVFIISIRDSKLSEAERAMLTRIANVIYGTGAGDE